MKKLIVDLLKESALDELKLMENDNKIKILNEHEVRMLAEKRDQIWKELEEYTYENIVKKMRGNIG